MLTLKDRLLHNQIFRSWLKSYLLLLLIPLLLMLGSYVVFSDAMESMVGQHWDEVLQTVQTEMDAEFADLGQLSTLCSLDEYVQAYARAGSLEEIQESPDRLKRIRGLNKAMTYYTVGLDFANAHYLYYNASDLLYSGGTFMTDEDLRKRSDHASIGYALRQAPGGGSGYLGLFTAQSDVARNVYYYANLSITGGNGSCLVLTELNQEFIGRKLGQYAAMFDGWIGLMDAEGRFYAVGGNELCRVSAQEAKQIVSGALIKLGHKAVFCRPSTQEGLSYVCSMTDITLNAQLRSFYIIMICVTILMLLLSAVTISRQIKRNYQPIHTLATTIINASGHDPKASMFDYPYLTASLQESAQQRSIMKQTLTEQLLRQLIRHRSEEVEISVTDMSLLEECLPSEYYLVLCLPLHDKDWSSIWGSKEKIITSDALNATLLAPLAEHLEDGCRVTGLLVEDYYAVLFSCDPAMARIKAENTFQRFIAALNAQGHQLIFAASCLHDSPLDLHQAYREAANAMRMNYTREQTPVIFYDELPNPKEYMFQRGSETRLQLANLIAAGRGEEAIAVMQELRQQVRGQGGVELLCWVDNIHTISHALMSSNLQVQLEPDLYHDYIQQLDLLASSTSRSFRRRDEAMDSFVRRLCEDIAAHSIDNAVEERSSLANTVDELIEKHLSDENLSIAMLAEEVGLNPKYMAMQYKEITGTSLLYSIHLQRINAFKRMLNEQPNLSIVQASAAVGYSSQNTLIRWFRKIEGVTPGEYRKIHKEM